MLLRKSVSKLIVGIGSYLNGEDTEFQLGLDGEDTVARLNALTYRVGAIDGKLNLLITIATAILMSVVGSKFF